MLLLFIRISLFSACPPTRAVMPPLSPSPHPPSPPLSTTSRRTTNPIHPPLHTTSSLHPQAHHQPSHSTEPAFTPTLPPTPRTSTSTTAFISSRHLICLICASSPRLSDLHKGEPQTASVEVSDASPLWSAKNSVAATGPIIITFRPDETWPLFMA